MILNLILLVFLNLLPVVKTNRVSYSIQEKSSLTLAGSSNINTFQCRTYQDIALGHIFIISDDNNNKLRFNNAQLKIAVKSFDCENPLLNKDFYKTLNAKESPTINVELLSALPLSNEKILRSGKGSFLADVSITLNANSKNDNIIVHWERVGNGLFHFMGNKELKMSDFDIASPVAALGLIKVNDEINIFFDLYIEASEMEN